MSVLTTQEGDHGAGCSVPFLRTYRENLKIHRMDDASVFGRSSMAVAAIHPRLIFSFSECYT